MIRQIRTHVPLMLLVCTLRRVGFVLAIDCLRNTLGPALRAC
jgi:hypothetical protein